MGNVRGQEWAANKIYRFFKDRLSVFVAAVGSTASIVGAKLYLEKLIPGIKFVGVGSSSKKDKVPGSRPEEDLGVTGFGYEEALAYYKLVTSVSKKEAFEASQELISNGISAGPTSGLTIAGFFKLLEQEYRAGRLNAMKNKYGKIVVCCLFMDMFLPYVEEYDAVLGVAS
jgi:cysteine synthase